MLYVEKSIYYDMLTEEITWQNNFSVIIKIEPWDDFAQPAYKPINSTPYLLAFASFFKIIKPEVVEAKVQKTIVVGCVHACHQV